MNSKKIDKALLNLSLEIWMEFANAKTKRKILKREKGVNKLLKHRDSLSDYISFEGSKSNIKKHIKKIF